MLQQNSDTGFKSENLKRKIFVSEASLAGVLGHKFIFFLGHWDKI
jgi:hypothetical protein